MRVDVRICAKSIGAAAVLLALAARAELPVDPLLTDPVTNEVPRGIVVPGPERPGSSGTGAVVEEPAPPPLPAPEFGSVMKHWKLGPAPVPSQDALALRNSDWLQGEFVGLDTQVLGWRIEGVPGLVRFQRQGLSTLRLRGGGKPPVAKLLRWVVQLVGGSLVTGQELALDKQQVLLQTSYAGQLRLPREMVTAIYQDIEPAGSALRLLQNTETWQRVTTGPGEMTAAPVFQNLDLPEAFLVEFELTRRQNQNLQVHLPMSAPNLLYSEPHLVCTIHQDQLTLSPTGGNGMFGGIQSVPLPKSLAGRWRIGIAVSRPQGVAILYVNGKEMRRLQLNGALRAEAKGIVILDHGGNAAETPVRTLLVTRINEELRLPASQPSEDLLRLANGDALVGQLESITASHLVCRGALGQLEMPLERMIGAVLAPGRAAEPRRRANDVVVQLVDGGHLTAELKEFGPQKLLLASDLFGEIELQRAAVNGIRFGLYQPVTNQVQNFSRPRDDGAELFEPGRLRLVSGVTLAGTWTSLANGMVGWQHPYALEPMLFALTNVSFANPLPSTASTNLPNLASTVQLSNGDSFRGELVSLDSQQLQVRTMYTGPLTVARRYVAGLLPNLPSEGVLEAGSIERWFVKPAQHRGNPDQIPYRQYLRQEKLPDRVCLQMQVSSKPGPWNLNCVIFGTAHDKNPLAVQQGYFLTVNQQNLMLHEPASGGQYTPPTTMRLAELAEGGSIRLTWLVDRTKRESFVLVDGKLVLQRRNIKLSAPGHALLVTVQNRNQCEIGEVILQPWTSRAEDVLASTKTTGDKLWLHDWNTRPGPIGGIRDGQVLLPGAESLGLGQVSILRFDPALAARARRTKNDVRVNLVNGDSFTLVAPQLDARGLVGTAEGLGTVIVDPKAVRRLHFRPYDPPPQPRRNARYGFGGMIFD